MKYREVKKLIGVVATASMLSACGTNLDQDNVVQNNTSEFISNEATTEQSEAQDVVTKATVTYEQSATEADELIIKNDEPQNYKVKDYQRPIFFKYLTDLDYGYTYDADTNSLNHGNTMVSDNVEVVEDDSIDNDSVDSDSEIRPIIYAKDFVIGDARPVVKYLRVSETEAEAKYISLVPSDSKLVSGITFEFRYDYDADIYKMTGILGVFGEDLSKLKTYEGEFDFYSATVDGDEYCKPSDTITVSTDTTLFPNYLENENALSANEDGTYVDAQSVETIDNMQVIRVIHVYKYKTDTDGTQKTVAAYALDGLNVDADTVKNTDGSTIDKEKVKEQQKDEVKEAEEKKKAEEEQKKKEEETKKKQEESKKKESGGGSGNSGSQKPSGNSGQTGTGESTGTTSASDLAGQLGVQSGDWGCGGDGIADDSDLQWH